MMPRKKGLIQRKLFAYYLNPLTDKKLEDLSDALGLPKSKVIEALVETEADNILKGKTLFLNGATFRKVG